MRIALSILTILVSGVAGGSISTPTQVLHVCVERSNESLLTLFPAVQFAGEMFAKIGVKLVPRYGSPRCKSILNEIRVRLMSDESTSLLRGSLGYTDFARDPPIVIFGDRVAASTEPVRVPNLLAHVLVHEIAHVLEGVPRHSSTGLMKAHWNERDIQELIWKPLPFAAEDVDLIRRGVEQRAESATAPDRPSLAQQTGAVRPRQLE